MADVFTCGASQTMSCCKFEAVNEPVAAAAVAELLNDEPYALDGNELTALCDTGDFCAELTEAKLIFAEGLTPYDDDDEDGNEEKYELEGKDDDEDKELPYEDVTDDGITLLGGG